MTDIYITVPADKLHFDCEEFIADNLSTFIDMPGHNVFTKSIAAYVLKEFRERIEMDSEGSYKLDKRHVTDGLTEWKKVATSLTIR